MAKKPAKICVTCHFWNGRISANEVAPEARCFRATWGDGKPVTVQTIENGFSVIDRVPVLIAKADFGCNCWKPETPGANLKLGNVA